MAKLIALLLLISGALLVAQPDIRLSITEALSSDDSSDSDRKEQYTAPAEAVITEAPAPEEVSENDEYPELDPYAIDSLSNARIHGDARTPPLNKTRSRDELPTEEQLEDPEQYFEYEQRQSKRVYRAFVEASKVKVARIREMIEQGKEAGVPQADIDFAEEKIRSIEEAAANLQEQFPDIMEDTYQPPSDWLLENSDDDGETADTAETPISR